VLYKLKAKQRRPEICWNFEGSEAELFQRLTHLHILLLIYPHEFLTEYILNDNWHDTFWHNGQVD